MLTEFKNETYLDFSKEENQKRMLEALQKIHSEFGKEYDLIIDGERVKANAKFNSYNPSEKEEVIGIFQKATEKEGEKAIQAAL